MIVIKIGGSIAGELHDSLVPDIARAADSHGGVIMVHGGGKDVSSVSTKILGHEPRFITSPSGVRSRYTDLDTVRVFVMVMAGAVNKSIVRTLQAGGVDAVGLSGIDGGLLSADRKKRLLIVNERGRTQAIEGGYTGKITDVNVDLLSALLERGATPVIAPVALSKEFDYLNVDGDRAAASVAAAMHADCVIFLTDVDGIEMDGSLVEEIDAEDARKMRPKIGAGMEKKVIASLEALDGGVSKAIIANGMRTDAITAAIAHKRCTVIRK